MRHAASVPDRKRTRLNSSHTDIYTLSLHDALPISMGLIELADEEPLAGTVEIDETYMGSKKYEARRKRARSEEDTSELQSHRYLHSFPTRRSSDLHGLDRTGRRGAACRDCRD